MKNFCFFKTFSFVLTKILQITEDKKKGDKYFYRRQILDGIALFLKTCVFSVSWEAEKGGKKKFLNSKRI